MRIALLLAVLATPATATEVVRLTDAQRDAVITAAANGPERPAVLTPVQSPRPSVLDRSLYPEFQADGGPAVADRKVHGEMSIFAGSGGTVGFAGTAVIPMGQNSMAAISVSQASGRFGGVTGFGLGFASGDARRSLGAEIGYAGFGSAFGPLFLPPGYARFGYGAAGFGDFGPPVRRRR